MLKKESSLSSERVCNQVYNVDMFDKSSIYFSSNIFLDFWNKWENNTLN